MSVDIPVGQNYLDLDDEAVVLNACEEQEFVVQAVIGSGVSENSPAVSGNFSVGEFFSQTIVCTVYVASMIIHVLFALYSSHLH